MQRALDLPADRLARSAAAIESTSPSGRRKRPSLFIGGEKDGPTRWGGTTIANFSKTLPGLQGSHVLGGCGHWVQQERPREVNELLVKFVNGL